MSSSLKFRGRFRLKQDLPRAQLSVIMSNNRNLKSINIKTPFLQDKKSNQVALLKPRPEDQK